MQFQTVKQRLMLQEKYRQNEGPKASRGYLVKLARTINGKHHYGFDDVAFCKQHGVVKR